MEKDKAVHSNLSDYYGRIGLNPVGHDISREERLQRHERKRRNLLERRLKLPFLLWRSARVLEFGPGSGENAIVLARHGARMTFVEPLDYLIAELRAKFTACGVSDRIDSVRRDVLESYRSPSQYDVVFAEGFVQFLDAPVAAVRKLCGFVAPGGFLVISVVHPAGTFLEFVKKVYLEVAASALGRTSDAERFALARRLFEPEFRRINHSRGFESWAKDCVLNPLYRPDSFLDLPELLAALPPDVQLYSSWPNYMNEDDLVWHKNVPDRKAARRDALLGYYARAPHFLHSIPQEAETLPLFDPTDGRAIVTALKSCYTKLDRLISIHSSEPSRALPALDGLRKALRPHRQSALALSIVEDARALFASARAAKDEAAFVRAWTARTLLRKTWGSPGHYFVFQRGGIWSV